MEKYINPVNDKVDDLLGDGKRNVHALLPYDTNGIAPVDVDATGTSGIGEERVAEIHLEISEWGDKTSSPSKPATSPSTQECQCMQPLFFLFWTVNILGEEGFISQPGLTGTLVLKESFLLIFLNRTQKIVTKQNINNFSFSLQHGQIGI